jgi:methyltransferase (TIGR00027 family)
MTKIFQVMIFIIIQFSLLPVTLAGYIYSVVQTMSYAKKKGVSMTATSVLGGRWIMHVFGTREDEATRKIATVLPFMSSTGWWMTMGPAYLAHRICGYTPKLALPVAPEKASLYTLVNSRSPLFDSIMERRLDQVDQVVVLGAGYDTRAIKYCKERAMAAFELDQAETQNIKVAALKTAGVDIEWLTFIAVDFNNDVWVDKLIESGFDTTKRSFFLWEGVTLYLDEEIVKQTLKDIAKTSGSGSVVAFDFYSKAFINFESSPLLKMYAKRMLKMSGEPFKYGIDTKDNAEENVERLLSETGFSLASFVLLGKDTLKVKPFAGVVEAVVK